MHGYSFLLLSIKRNTTLSISISVTNLLCVFYVCIASSFSPFLLIAKGAPTLLHLYRCILKKRLNLQLKMSLYCWVDWYSSSSSCCCLLSVLTVVVAVVVVVVFVIIYPYELFTLMNLWIASIIL
jgi:hypothetical protein